MPQRKSRAPVAAGSAAKVFPTTTIAENLSTKTNNDKGSFSRAAPANPLAERAANIAYQNRVAAAHAADVLRSGGYLLHVDPITGVERHLTVAEAAAGKPYLSVWCSDGVETTMTYNVGRFGYVQPRGNGWKVVQHEWHWTEWRRPVLKEQGQ